MAGLPSAGWVGVLMLVLLVNGYGEEMGWPARRLSWRCRGRPGTCRSSGSTRGCEASQCCQIPGFFLGMAAGAVVLGWLYEHAHSILLVVAPFHATLNMASATSGTEGGRRRRGVDSGDHMGGGHPARRASAVDVARTALASPHLGMSRLGWGARSVPVRDPDQTGRRGQTHATRAMASRSSTSTTLARK
jgi:hypothetical protein